MARDRNRVHVRPQRAVTALRGIVLLVLAGVTLALVASYGGRRGKPQAEITMAPALPSPPGQGPVVDQSDLFEINGSREGRPAFTLRARSVTGFAGERKLLHAVHLKIHDDEGRSVEVAGLEGHFDATQRRAQLSGDVVIEAGDGLSMKTGTLYYDSDRDVVFTADEIVFSVGAIEGEGRGLNYLVGERQIKIPADVRLRMTDAEGSEATSITAGDLVATLRENTAVLTQDVRVTRGNRALRGNYVKLSFDESRRRVTALSAFGDVVASLEGAGAAEGSDLRADSLTTRFGAPGQILDEAEASGGCRITSGPYTSSSLSARYRRVEGRIDLRGDPVVRTARDRIAAQEIDLHPGPRTLEARGDVRTVSLPEPRGEVAAPGFSARSAISFQAERLRVDQGGRRAAYSGTARAWQEGNSIQADEIVVDQSARQLRATGNVIARWTEAPRTGAPAAARPAVTSITSKSMLLDDARGVAVYRDDVRLTRPDATLTSDAMDGYLQESDGRRDLQRVVATGSVAVKRAGSYGTARSAEYLADQDLLILKDEGGLAEVVDVPTGRTMRGRTLTFDLAGDRILTESEGGRTWITLTPERKDVPSVEPKTRH